MSSCVSFTTGPIFAGLVAYILIGEKLSMSEVVAILFGILGTMMLTMPQWFMFLNLDNEEISKRLKEDLAANSNYYLGIILALISAASDTVTYFIIRKVGAHIPNSMIPFISGIFTTPIMLIYTSIYEPLEWNFFFKSDPTEADIRYKQALLYALGASILAWVALEFMCIGLQISKSAIASYGEMVGITVPFLYDGIFLGRNFLSIDALGITFIITLQVYNALKK